MDLNLQLFAIIGFFSSIFLYSVLLRRTKITTTCNARNAPEPIGSWPIIGHLHMLLGGAYKLLHQKLGIMTDKYGPAFCIRLGSRCAFVVASKEVAKECFTTNDRALASRPTTAATKHMCYNNTVFGFAPYSPHWREMRKIVMLELLSNSQLEIIKNVQALVVNAGIRKLYSLWAANNNKLPVLVELKQWSQYITFDVIVRLVAGKCYDDGT
ncbi:xanthotoxin 5-hydroxylase CYP82C4-like isoform X2 [Jatropha curcas]|uniref:xanthotoxin 5-hydroxylase CYP82C4-like isoform X2 n=1 Tax=Jatropha curcas TaxID=180498 RepID=UPI001894BE45|nr:xanthotoxin 5-hydroxylase CYP82C4-like isoform X2 [Jatropha curcas]